MRYRAPASPDPAGGYTDARPPAPGAPRIMTKDRIGFLKLAAAAAILTVLVATGRLSPRSLSTFVAHPATVLGLLALQVAILMIGVFRWWLILGAVEGRRPRYRDLLSFNWIGQFFGTVAPSTVATDATRFGYVVSSGMASRSGALMSLVIDRTAGIAGTTLLAIVMSRAYAIESLQLPSPLVVAAGFLITLGCVRLLRHRMDRVQAALATMGRAKGASAAAVAFAMLAMLLKVVSIWSILGVISPANASVAFIAAPVGFLAEALPITPGGLGTAHLAFEFLFGQQGIEGGATFFSVYFMVRLAVSLVGGVLWVARRDQGAGFFAPPDCFGSHS
jgi:glycosyltransferase 2 family protein